MILSKGSGPRSRSASSNRPVFVVIHDVLHLLMSIRSPHHTGIPWIIPPMTPAPFLRPLFDGPIDVIGDIHGEIEALVDLLDVLGYDSYGRHPAGRRLVFIGDLCDRGPDSPAVIAFVRSLVEEELAQCLLGNHELNLLRDAAKEGNGWFFAEDHDAAEGLFTMSRRATADDRRDIRAFLATLPLALERADLRLVHATWDEAALALLRECSGPTTVIYEAYAQRTRELAERTGLEAQAVEERRKYGEQLRDAGVKPPLLEGIGRVNHLHQMGNPLRILTSGIEALAQEPFFASGKWRMLDRVQWWNRYAQPKPVLVGHYWRWPDTETRLAFSRGEHDLFAGVRPEHWHGRRRNVFCLDFGVGARYQERREGREHGFRTRLGAVRWPEGELVFDDGQRMALSGALRAASTGS